ncbi:ABC transporter substrate-binding protein [Hahella ganghwensis]|uniref:ABC transporter substrate-binding protein n=1 Tax=Hahella ganghwensis TaxID=286420 RepID=UPI000378772A|nr:ABC transporter substrate-binding protein [Hahella ganghwensis]
MKYRYLRICLLWLTLGICLPTNAHHETIHVTFLNPGWAAESFWGDVDAFMIAAARQLNINLTIMHGNRDVFRTLEMGEQIGRSRESQDFIILVNEKNTGPRLLELTSRKEVPTLLILNDLSDDQKKVFGEPRQQFVHWLGSLVPDNQWVGYQVARKMHHAMRTADPNRKVFKWFAISGDRLTLASIQREKGMRLYVSEHPDIELVNVVYGEWNELKATDLVRALLKRSVDVNGIWTANDHMAFGSIIALDEFGLVPGKDVFIGTVNSSEKVLDYLDKGIIAALGAGHFTAGGWALLLAHDYHHGYDGLADNTVLQQSLFDIIQPDTEAFRILRNHEWDKFPIASYGRFHQSDWSGYNFSLSPD